MHRVNLGMILGNSRVRGIAILYDLPMTLGHEQLKLLSYCKVQSFTLFLSDGDGTNTGLIPLIEI